MLLKILIILFTLKQIHSIQLYDCARLNKTIKHEDYEFYQILTLTINNFYDFSELKFNCSVHFRVALLQFIPNQPLVLDSKLNMSGLNIIATSLTIHFTNLKGINVFADSKFGLNPLLINSFLIDISYSNLAYYKNGLYFEIEDCYANLSEASFFKTVQGLVYRNFNFYAKPICPRLFNNSSLRLFVIGHISNSLLNKNIFEFMSVDSREKEKISNQLETVYVTLTYERLTSKILNELVFKNIKCLSISFRLDDIESDLFKNLNKLSKISLNLHNMRDFFHQGNKWLPYLKYNSGLVDLSVNKIYNAPILNVLFRHDALSSFNQVYKYPDEDFCLFYRFPHEKLVYPLLDPGKSVNCSCTILWLLQFTSKFYSLPGTDSYWPTDYFNFIGYDEVVVSLSYCLFQPSYLADFNACKFEDRMSGCNKSNFIAKNQPSFIRLSNDIDIKYMLKWLELIILVILNPVFAFLGFLANLLVLIVIRNMKNLKKHQIHFSNNKTNRNMIKHVRINSFFNMLYCLIMMLKLINECLFITSQVYCSSIALSSSSQYFKIAVIEFLGNVIKVSCNLSYLGISVSRFILISKKTHGLYKKFIDIKTGVYMFYLLSFGCVLSLFKLFQYKINYKYFSFGTLDFPNEIRSSLYCESHQAECLAFNFAKIANNIANDVVFLGLILGVDVLLFKNYGRFNRNKKKLVGKSCRQEEAHDAKHRITKMIIINGVVYFCAHFPELVMLVLLYAFQSRVFYFCSFQMTCDKLNEMAQFFVFISIISQFFINNAFNKHFNESFRHLFNRKLHG